jgi:lipopolysaccharide/colanic/teichoic acid biosynthesis glycosyltransferase
LKSMLLGTTAHTPSRLLVGSSKRLIDLVVSGLAMVLLAPAFLCLALAIRLSSPGPILFRQQRAGRHGRPFTLLKFRTMRTAVDPFGPSPRSGDDPRLTPVGRFLREHSLDELPQLWNVVMGHMSLVGPRPLYVAQMAEWNDRQRRRLEVRPGLTGLAQIAGRGNLPIEQKLELDVRYVESASLWLDLKILFATASLVFHSRGIYERQYSQAETMRGEAPAHSRV